MDAALHPHSPEALVAAQSIASVRANVIVALVGATVMLLEYFDTFALEVELMWPSDWSLVKFLYFANRVSPVIVVPWTPIYNLISNPKPMTCQILFGAQVLSICTAIIISEGLLYLRLYALSGRKRWALVFLMANIILSSLLAYVVLLLFVAHGTWVKEVEGVSGCRTIHASNLLVVVGFTTLLYSGLTAMLLSIFFGVRAYWASRDNPLVQIFYRDGTFYFIVLAVMSVGNGIAALFLPPGYRYIMVPLQAVMHTTLSNRMVLRLKAQAKHGMGPNVSATSDSSASRLGPLHFRENTYLFSSPYSLRTLSRDR